MTGKILHSFVLVAFLAALGAASPRVSAAEAESRGDLRLGDLISLAHGSNPSIIAAREKWRSTVERYRVATGYPDPQLMVTWFPEPIETRLGPQDWNLNLSQTIPFPGKLSKAGEVVGADARIARLELDRTIREVTGAIRESWHELGYIRRAGEIAEANIELLDHMRKVAETAYADDRAIFLDVVKSQSEVAQLRYDLLLLGDLEMTEVTRLNGLLDRPPGHEIGDLAPESLPPLAYGLEEVYALAETSREAIRIAGARVEKAQAGVDLAGYSYLPTFKAGLFYAAIGRPDVAAPPPDAGDDALGVQLGLSIPLWLDKNRGAIAGARAEKERARAMRRKTINDTRTKIHALYFRMENASRLMELYGKEMLPQAERSMEIAETWFSQGEGSLSDFIETRAVWYNFQLSLARARADYGKYLARMETLAGRDLTRREPAGGGEGGKK
jgi:outer membrane protein TolC